MLILTLYKNKSSLSFFTYLFQINFFFSLDMVNDPLRLLLAVTLFASYKICSLPITPPFVFLRFEDLLLLAGLVGDLTGGEFKDKVF